MFHNGKQFHYINNKFLLWSKNDLDLRNPIGYNRKTGEINISIYAFC